jgi:hypothetical protein
MSNLRLRVFLFGLGLVVLAQVISGFFLIRQVDAWCQETSVRLAVYTGVAP